MKQTIFFIILIFFSFYISGQTSTILLPSENNKSNIENIKDNNNYYPFMSGDDSIFEGTIEIWRQYQIDHFNPNIKYVKGVMFIVENEGIITDLHGLANLKGIDGGLNIQMTTGLKDLSGLDNLQELGAIILMDNSGLESIESLSKIDFMYGVEIEYNSNLRSLKGLHNVREIMRPLYIVMNPRLKDLNGLNNLEHVDMDIVIDGNDSLNSLKGLENLTHVDIICIIDNKRLSNLEGLRNINRIVYFIELGGSPRLKSLEGLNNLNFVGDLILIGENKGGEAIPNDSLSDFCAISELVLSKDEGKVHISNNRYNPSYEDFENGDCSFPFISSKEIFELNVQISPNPASEFVFISSPENLNTIKLIHISGNIVF